jgi:hypothetical protein
MKKSALKTAVAMALCAAGCVSFAQQSSDASGNNNLGSASGSSVSSGTGTGSSMSSGSGTNSNSGYGTSSSGSSSSSMDSTSSSGTGYGRTAMYGSGNRNCSGLSDRQTERACRQGYPTQHSNQPGTDRSVEAGGLTDDQAD